MLAGFTHRPVVELSERLAALAPREPRPRVLRLRRRLGDRDRAQDGLPLLAEPRPARKDGFLSARRRLPRRDARRARRDRRARLPRRLRAAAPAQHDGALAGRARRGAGRNGARRRRARGGRARRAPRARTTRSIAALIVEPLVQGASRHGDVRPALPRAGARAVHALRRAADRRRDHDRASAAPGRCSRASRRASPRTSSACRRASPAATCRFPACCRPTRSSPRSTPTTRRAASCTRTRTPGNALACRAALAVLDIFRDDDVLAANRAKAARWTALAAPLAAHPKVRDFRQRGHDLGLRSRDATRRFRALVLRRRRWRASSCCGRSAAPSTSCRPTS